MIWRCDLVPQYQRFDSEIQSAINEVLLSGRYILGDNVQKFEAEFAEYVGTKCGVGLNSGFDALVFSLRILGIQPGDEVITTPFTAIPTYSAIRAVGAIPVFVDIDPKTFLINIDLIPAAITSKTRAVLPVHLFGNCVDIPRLRALIGPDLPILEDCAQSHGATVDGKQSGSMGTISAFSFFPTKNLGGYGDGGMVMTQSREISDQLKKMRMYGMVNKDEIVLDGLNSRLDELQAAILRIKLKSLNQLNQERKHLAAHYFQKLNKSHVSFQKVNTNVTSAFHVFPILVPAHRTELVKHLEDVGIQANIYYPMPLYKQAAYVESFGKYPKRLACTEDICDRVLALPFYPEMDIKIADQVIGVVNSWCLQKFS